MPHGDEVLLVKSWQVGLPGKLLPARRSLPEEWNDQFPERNPSCKCDEKSKHAEEYDRRGFVGSLGKRL